jgi:hypothetical protein
MLMINICLAVKIRHLLLLTEIFQITQLVSKLLLYKSKMASKSYAVPARTPTTRMSAGEIARPSPSRKRKVSTISEANTPGNTTSFGGSPSGAKKTGKSKAPYVEGDNVDQYGFSTAHSHRKKSKKCDPAEEKRLRAFRTHAPQSYLERLDRVRSQRMFLIDRERKSSVDGSPEEEVFEIAGTTGNIYQVKVGKVPSCTCPDAKKGNQCKHIVYVSDLSIVDLCLSLLTDILRYLSTS